MNILILPYDVSRMMLRLFLMYFSSLPTLIFLLSSDVNIVPSTYIYRFFFWKTNRVNVNQRMVFMEMKYQKSKYLHKSWSVDLVAVSCLLANPNRFLALGRKIFLQRWKKLLRHKWRCSATTIRGPSTWPMMVEREQQLLSQCLCDVRKRPEASTFWLDEKNTVLPGKTTVARRG